MRRPVLYLAGMLLATGASLALAGPASAAVADGKRHHHGHHHGHHGHGHPWFWLNDDNDDCDDEDGGFFNSGVYSTYEHNETNGISILSSQGSNASLLGGGLL